MSAPASDLSSRPRASTVLHNPCIPARSPAPALPHKRAVSRAWGLGLPVTGQGRGPHCTLASPQVPVASRLVRQLGSRGGAGLVTVGFERGAA